MSSSAMAQYARGGVPSPLSLESDAIDPRQAIEAIAHLATRDPSAALQLARETLAGRRIADPAADHETSREIASAIATQLDDDALDALSESPAGRELLQLLAECGGDAAQPERLHHALHGAAALPGGSGFALHAAARPDRRRSLRPRRA